MSARPAAEAHIAAACPEDLEAALALLDAASLPRAGVAEHFASFLIARDGGRVLGTIGLERYGQSALLRSLAVAASHRRRRLGQALTERVLESASRQGVRRVFLLTTTAAVYFPRFGFAPIAREAADAAVRRSVEFTQTCPASAVCMRLEL